MGAARRSTALLILSAFSTAIAALLAAAVVSIGCGTPQRPADLDDGAGGDRGADQPLASAPQGERDDQWFNARLTSLDRRLMQ